MQKTRYDVVPKGDEWVVEADGKSTPPLPTKEMAVEAATRRAKEDAPAQVVVHGQERIPARRPADHLGSFQIRPSVDSAGSLVEGFLFGVQER
jgi:Uncharacterized protein conserved in bacteria (DUF2188)